MNETTFQNKCPECQRETTTMFHIDGQAMCGICKNIHFPPAPVVVQGPVVGFTSSGEGELRKIIREELLNWGDESPATCLMLDVVIAEMERHKDDDERIEALLRSIYREQSAIKEETGRAEDVMQEIQRGHKRMAKFIEKVAVTGPTPFSEEDLIDLQAEARGIKDVYLKEKVLYT